MRELTLVCAVAEAVHVHLSSAVCLRLLDAFLRYICLISSH